MSHQNRSSKAGNHDLFENVQDLRRRLQETERTLYTLNVQERAVEGSHHPPSAFYQTRVPPVQLGDITGDDSVEIQHILGASSHRSDGSSPRVPKGQQKSSRGDRPVTYGSTQPQSASQYSAKHDYDSDTHRRANRGYTAQTDPNELAFQSQKGSGHLQDGYTSPRASKHSGRSRRQARSHDVAAESHDILAHQGVQAKRSSRDIRDDSGNLVYDHSSRQYQKDGQSRSNSTQDLHHASNSGLGGFEVEKLDPRRVQVDLGRSRSFQNLSQRSALTGISDMNQDITVSSDSNFDVTSLRHKIHNLREENAKLVSQNHKLLNQLEDLGFEKKRAIDEIEAMKSEMKKQTKISEELQEQLVCLQSGSKSHEKALRESEERCDDYQRDVAELDSLLMDYKAQVVSLEEQISEQENMLKRYESERNKSLDTAEEIQRAYEEHQKRAREKLKKMEASEEHYKEKLKYVDEQREQLIKETEAYKSQLRELSEQVRVVQDDGHIEKESRHEAEQHNLQLRSQLALLQQKCVQLEQTVRFQEGVERENESLKRSLNEHKNRLEQCQMQIGESQAELQRLEELAATLNQGKGRANASESKDLNGSYLETLETDNEEMTVAELRRQLEVKEQELLHVQSVLNKSKAEGGQTESQESLRRQLRVTTDRNRQADLRIEELETLLLRLEEERATTLKKLANQEEQLSDLKISTDSLDTKLTHRNNQVVELQKELDERMQEVSRIERELRKKTSQISSLERQLDSKVTEVSDQVSKVSDLEEEVETKTAQLQQLNASLEEKTRELVQSNSMAQKLKSIHVEQCKELEKQIELLEKRFQEKEAYLKEQGGTIDRLRSELIQKDSTLNEAVRRAQLEVEKKCIESDAALKAFERKSEEATQRVKQLESSLVVCKEELNVYVEQYQETKTRHELEIADRESKVGDLEDKVAECKELLSEREQQVAELQTSLKGRLEMVEQSAARISELEEGHSGMVSQVSSLEQQLHTERSKLENERLSMEGEVKVMEGKLQQACVEVESKNTEIQELLNTVSDLELEKEAMSEEVSELERQLGQEKTDSDSRLSQLEETHRELRQLRGQVKDREEKVEDLTESMNRQKQDNNEKSSEIRRLTGEIKQLKMEQQLLSDQCAESQQEVDALNLELGDKKRILEEHRLTIRRKEDDVRSKAREMETLERALEERNWELQQRAAQLTQIDMEVREHKTDMDQRNVRMEGQLKQFQLETQQKNKQLADLDDRLRETHEELREKSLQLQQSEQSNRKLKLEMENQAAEAQDKEMQLYTLRHRLESSLTENTELGMELKTAREEIQKIHYELTESRREYSVNKRELEKHRKENQEMKQKVQENESQLTSLSEQLGESRAREQRLEGQADVEMRKLVTEVDAMQSRHVSEIKSLTSKLTSKSDAETSKDAELEEMRLKQIQLKTQADEAQKQAGHFEGQLQSCQRLIEQLQATVETKNSEVARLKGRLVGYENTSSVSSHTNSVHPPILPENLHTGYQSTALGSLGYQSAGHTNTIDSLGHLNSSRDSRTVSHNDEPNNDPLFNQNVSQVPQLEKLPVKVTGSSQSLAYDKHATQFQGTGRDSIQGQPGMIQGVGGNEIPSQDDSIVSLLNRMQMHERNVEDMLHSRLSTGIREEPVSTVSHNVGGAFASANQHGGASQNDIEGKVRSSDITASSLEVEGGHCYHSGVSSSSSGRGTLMGSDLGTVHPDQLADYLANDPESFQAMFKRLKDSYTSSGSNTLTNAQDSSQRVAVDSSFDSQYLLSQRQLIPTKDDQKTQGATASQHVHAGYKPIKQGPDSSMLSSISESESLKSALSKKSRGSSNLGAQQYTSSPKANRNPKKSVRISAPTQGGKGGMTKLNSKNSTGPKTSKKSNNNVSSGNSTKKPAKPGCTGTIQTGQKQSRFGALVAKGLANIEAAAHPNKKVPKSPGESESSPNVSTAISHYATDVDQSHGGSFLSTDQSGVDNIIAQSGSSGEDLYTK